MRSAAEPPLILSKIMRRLTVTLHHHPALEKVDVRDIILIPNPVTNGDSKGFAPVMLKFR